MFVENGISHSNLEPQHYPSNWVVPVAFVRLVSVVDAGERVSGVNAAWACLLPWSAS